MQFQNLSQVMRTRCKKRTLPYVADIGGTANNVAKQWASEESLNFMAEVDAWTLVCRGLTKEDKAESIGIGVNY